jgi:hypothetical protein
MSGKEGSIAGSLARVRRASRCLDLRKNIEGAQVHENPSLTRPKVDGVIGPMLDWHAQNYRNGQAQERPATFSSAKEAIVAADVTLRASTADEVVVYHRLYSDQAFLKIAEFLEEADVLRQAAHLEQQARRASHTG